MWQVTDSLPVVCLKQTASDMIWATQINGMLFQALWVSLCSGAAVCLLLRSTNIAVK